VICWYVLHYIDRHCGMLIDTAVCWYVLCCKCCVVLADKVLYWYVLCDNNRYCDIQDICYALLKMLWYKNACCVILTRDVLYWKYCDVRIKKFQCQHNFFLFLNVFYTHKHSNYAVTHPLFNYVFQSYLCSIGRVRNASDADIFYFFLTFWFRGFVFEWD
jgi:hypothetical protein